MYARDAIEKMEPDVYQRKMMQALIKLQENKQSLVMRKTE
jgi:hypothetical protein